MPGVVCKVWSEGPQREAGKWSLALEGAPPHRRWREVSHRLSQPPAFRRRERRRRGEGALVVLELQHGPGRLLPLGLLLGLSVSYGDITA